MILADVPYVPSSWDNLEVMLKLAKVKAGQSSADLGAGDGRVVVAFAKAGAKAHGFEIDPSRVKLGRRNIEQEGLTDRGFIHHSNFWDEDLGKFDIITVYGIGNIMGKLEMKLRKEAKIGCKVISNSFTFPNWQYITKKDNVFLYVK